MPAQSVLEARRQIYENIPENRTASSRCRFLTVTEPSLCNPSSGFSSRIVMIFYVVRRQGRLDYSTGV